MRNEITAALGGTFLLLCTSIQATSESAPDEPRISEGYDERTLYFYTEGGAEGGGNTQSQAVAGARQWDPNRKLKVCMFGGNKVIASLIRQAAGKWNGLSSVNFDFGPEPQGYNCLSPSGGFYQIRVGFGGRGYWSFIGNDSESRAEVLAPSMNLEGFNTKYSEPRFTILDVYSKAKDYDKSVIVHEFGHALALLHEAQNKNMNCRAEIRWTGKNNVYDYYAKPPNNWGREQVERNIGFATNIDPDFISGKPDSKSPMMYMLPKEILTRGADSKCYLTAPNIEISDGDKEILAQVYPLKSEAEMVVYAQSENSKVRTSSADMSLSESKDLRERLIVDLESDDILVRRDARVRLGGLLQSSNSADDLKELVSKMAGASYRYQLGVAVAIANAPRKVNMSEEVRKVLVDREQLVDDSTLKNSLRAALDKDKVLLPPAVNVHK
ncbi:MULTISPECIES: hypothetical protein [unclassified Pseudomonas]|uniref:hypothetical protein n=1 Tax=unclassified Pseudomonas TaxID=196821 RepID=UPI002118F413|nr:MULTISPECIES: hypothetical protein [unclassified Pseudomonas]